MPRQIWSHLLCKPLYNSAFIATAFAFLSFIAAQAEALGEPGEIELTLEDGKTFTAYTAGPRKADQAILVLHDWFGISDLTKEAVSRLAGDKTRVVAVDLYDGKAATTHKEAWALMQGVVNSVADEKISATLDHMNAGSRPVALFGMSMGADHAWRTALGPRAKDIGAVVIWYGTTPGKTENLAVLEAPALAIYGSKDGDAATQAASFSKAMDKAGKHGEAYIYPGAAHAFAQPLFNEGKTYDGVAAEVAWRLTEDFLGRHGRTGAAIR